MIIGLIGRKGSGKGAVARTLQEAHGAAVYRMSEILRSIADELGLPKTRQNLIQISETARTYFGQSVLAHAIAEQIKNDTHDIVVIDGIRRQADLDGFHDLDMVLVNVTAPLDVRFERIRSRGENDGETTMTREKFEALENAPTEVTIGDIEGNANVTIENTGSLDELKNQIKTVIIEPARNR